MFQDNVRAMRCYFDDLVADGDFSTIAMRDDLRFVGPLSEATTADQYRQLCRDLSPSVNDITIRTIVGDDDVVHAVYDIDMGLPTGPLPTSQTVAFIDGAFSTVEVIFDAAAVVGAAS